VWRGRHVSDPTELNDQEATEYWLELLRVGRAIEARYAPVKLNLYILSNTTPHLHCMIVPRYLDDPGAGGFLRYAPASEPHEAAFIQAEATALGALALGNGIKQNRQGESSWIETRQSR
jgi:diadenosine tetraphosphate (Ap4A) HIT family hydrolase